MNILPPKVLFVDDEPLLKAIVMQKFKSKIQNKELCVVFAANGLEALKLIDDDENIGVVFTDINMPIMDGHALLQNLVNRGFHYRTIVVSAYGDMSNIRRAMNSGAIDFITKPVNFQDLEIILNKAIVQYQQIKMGMTAQYQIVEFHKELEIAKNIQQAFIPHNFEPVTEKKNYEIIGEMLPVKEVGGDFYDFFPIPNDKLALVIADVSDKGIPAALFMVLARTLMRATAITSEKPHECLVSVNNFLCYDNPSGMFTTLFYGALDLNTGILSYANAGHNPPYIVSSDGTIEKFGYGQGVALGVFNSFQAGKVLFQTNQIQMKAGDILVLYTDGVTEALDDSLMLYGTDRLEAFLKQSFDGKPLKDMLDALKEDILKFAKGANQADDITICFLRYLGVGNC